MTALFKKYKEELIAGFTFAILAVLFNNYRHAGDASYYLAIYKRLFLWLGLFKDPNYVLGPFFVQQYGTSFFYLPFMLLADMVFKCGLLKIDQFQLEVVFLAIGNNIYACATLVLLTNLLKKMKLPLNSLFLMFFATPYFLFAIPIAGQTHIVDAFLITLITYFVVLSYDRSPKYAVLLGLLTALSIYVRYSNLVIFLCLLVFYFVKHRNLFLYYLSGAIILLWFLPVSLWLFNGEAIRGNYYFTLSTVKLAPLNIPLFPIFAFKVLLHPMHGLFVWSPLTLLAMNGIILYFEEKRDLAVLFLSWFLGIVCCYGCFFYWYGGWSFSQRYLIGLFPIYVIGYAYFLKAFYRLGLFLGILCLIWATFLFFNWGTIIHGEEGIPQDIVHYYANKRLPINYYIGRIESKLPAINYLKLIVK